MNDAISSSIAVEALLLDRLLEERDRAGAQGVRRPVADRPETMCTGMWRVAGWCFRWSSTVQPSITGRPMSRTIASGLYSCASARPGRRGARRCP